jgi:phosphoribosylpyrophosphate synthetase
MADDLHRMALAEGFNARVDRLRAAAALRRAAQRAYADWHDKHVALPTAERISRAEVDAETMLRTRLGECEVLVLRLAEEL